MPMESTHAFRKNLKLLEQKHPQLAAKVKALDGETGNALPALEVVQTPSGKPTFRLEGNFIHSRYDPEKEAQRLIGRELKPGIGLVIFYGFGLGYLVEAFYRCFSNTMMVVIEPEPHLFIRALQLRDLTLLLSQGQIHWFLGEEPRVIVHRLEELLQKDYQILRLRSLGGGYAQYFQTMDQLLQAQSDRRAVNINTLRRFGKLWVRNLLKNLLPFIQSPGVTQLGGIFQGVPALILAAGPSLDLVLPRLPELRKRLLLVAVDTSLGPCLERGVEPDFLVVVDPQYWNSRYLDWTEPETTVLISESSTHPRVFRLLRGLKCFFLSSFFPLGQFLESIVGQKGRVGAGGSVSTTAWDFTRLMAARPIYAAGLDLGFPDKRTHSRGTFFEERMHLLSHRFNPAEAAAYGYLYQAGPFLSPSNGAKPCYTDRRLSIYKWWFEGQLKQYPPEQVESYNLSPRGVRIEGMPHTPLNRLMDLPERREEIDRRMERVRALPSGVPEDGKPLDRVRQALGSLAEDLAALRLNAAEGIDICRRLKSHLPARGGKVEESLKRLDRLDQKINQLTSRQIAAFLFQPLIHKIDQSGGGNSLGEVINTTEALYRELEASSSYHQELIQAALLGLQNG